MIYQTVSKKIFYNLFVKALNCNPKSTVCVLIRYGRGDLDESTMELANRTCVLLGVQAWWQYIQVLFIQISQKLKKTTISILCVTVIGLVDEIS